MLSDIDKKVSELYDVKGLLFAPRKTFVIDKEFKIYKFYDSVDVTTHANDILDVVKDLMKTGSVKE